MVVRDCIGALRWESPPLMWLGLFTGLGQSEEKGDSWAQTFACLILLPACRRVAGWSQEASTGHSRQSSMIRCLRLLPPCFPHHVMNCDVSLQHQIDPSSIILSLDRYFINTMRKAINTPSLSTTLPLPLTARKPSQVKMNE